MKDDWKPGQRFGREVRKRSLDGVRYHSARYPPGLAAAIFWPNCLTLPITQNQQLRYRGDGPRMTLSVPGGDRLDHLAEPRCARETPHRAVAAIIGSGPMRADGRPRRRLIESPQDPRSHASLEDANAIVSDLAYWIGCCDSHAALRMTEGFGAALSSSAAMRARGSEPQAIALALAETADRLRRSKDAQHAGWLLLSVKIELLHLAATNASSAMAQRANELFGEAEQIARQLVKRGTVALAEKN